MLPSLGYVTELGQAADRGKLEIKSKVDIERQEVRDVVRAAFPDTDSVTLHGEPTVGAGGITYVFTTDDQESKYVLKAAPEEAARRLRKGAEMYKYLHELTGVPVPAVYTIRSSSSKFSYPYSIVEHVPGDELSSIQQFKSFPRERKKTLVREMGRVLGQLHKQTQFKTYGPISVRSDCDLAVDDGVSDWRGHYLTTYEEYAQTADGSPVKDLAVRAYEFFKRESRDVCPQNNPVLLHADFTPDNFVTKQGSIQAVLDWDLARAGCRAKEFWDVEENIVHIFQTKEVRRDLRDALYEGYREVASISETFLATKSIFAVGEFTKIGNVYAVVDDVNSGLEASDFVARAESELGSRIEAAESRLTQIR
jgi:aminoglycoside phosphotransferase (APT) family kinase protein